VRHREQALAAACVEPLRPQEGSADGFHARPEALEQQLFLAAHVAVDRRLGDVQCGSDVIEGGVVVTAIAERPCRGQDDRLALQFPFPGAVLRIAPG
jgi:hypothetical protein